MEFKEFMTTRYVLGSGCLEKLAEFKGSRIALVVDGGILKALDLEDRLFGQILDGIDCKVVADIPREPLKSMLEVPIAEVREYGPDYIVAIGGGSVMDAAKAIWLFYELPEYDWERAMVPYGVEPFPGKAKMIAIPTTSGTGSETSCCSMMIDEAGNKCMILSFEIIPTMAFMDYDLLKSLPAKNIAYSGTDALAHALGAAVSKPASELVKAVALQASVMLINHLPASSAGDFEARRQVHIAATLAGQAINNSMTGLEHSLAKVGEVFGLPHGLVSGLLLPYVMRFQMPNPVYAELADQLGISGDEERQQTALIDTIWDVYDRIGMPRTLREAGVPEAEYLSRMPGHIEATLGEFALQTGPKPPNADEMAGLIREFYYGSN